MLLELFEYTRNGLINSELYIGASLISFLVGIWALIFLMKDLQQRMFKRKVYKPPLVKEDSTSFSEVLVKNPTEFLQKCRKTYGNIFTLQMENGKKIAYCFDRQKFKYILTTFDFYTASKQSKERFGLHELLQDLPKLTTLLKKAMNLKYINPILNDLQEQLKIRLRKINQTSSNSKEVNLYKFTEDIIGQSFLDTLFGKGLYDKMFYQDYDKFTDSLSARHAGSNPGIAKNGTEAMKNLKKRITNIIQNKNRTPFMELLNRNVLSKFQLNEDTIVSFYLMLIWASQINLRPTVFWMLAYISKQEKLAEIIRSEGASILNGTNTSKEKTPLLNLSQVQNMKHTIAIIKEIFRLCSRPNIYRCVLQDTAIETDKTNYNLSKGEWIALFPKLIHFDETVYKNPTCFNYDRFYNQPTSIPDPLVFGEGMGMCPAKYFTYYILATIAYTLCNFADFSIDEQIPVANERTVASSPPPLHDVVAKLKFR